ncbi:MAG: hypothetical protein O9325_08290 [Roseomonas sp.]|nr:hypothetical protein [Roseomonas sp.]
MTDSPGWFDRFVDNLPRKRWFQFLAARVVVPYWAARCPTPPLPGGPRPAIQPGENVQRMMNLVMPLKNKSAIGRAEAAIAIAENVDEIFAGLDNVGTVHFARFVVIGDNLCMISVYDGDFSNYIRDFIAAIGSVFNAIVAQVEGGEKVIPCEKNIDAFIEWVHAHDLFQLPDFPTDLLDLQDEARGVKSRPPAPGLMRSLSRELVLQFHANPNAMLGGGYKAYPGYSVAQLRSKLGVGW